MEFVRIPELGVEISLRPISREEYWRISLKSMSGLVNNREANIPVTGVSATEARDFAGQMGGRLPTLDEIKALATYVQTISSAFACSKQGCLSEWLDCSPDWVREKTSSNCIVSPSWLRRQNGESPRGSIPNRRMSFVTFRLVRE